MLFRGNFVYFALKNNFYTVAGRAILNSRFTLLRLPNALRRRFTVASGILKQLLYITEQTQNRVNG
ncbi:MAG: hypothetical protein LBJ00_07000 [Planctomycetaceae bacterium]|nr:hypothetical protein [Planctomycetaceae bacterium]